MTAKRKKEHDGLFEAWLDLWRTRCCPPEEVIAEQSESRRVEAHLDICPWCRSVARECVASTQERSSMHDTACYDTYHLSILPTPGMIFSPVPALGEWGRAGRYVNPPPVMALEPLAADGSIKVAQVCGIMLFACSYDVIVNGICGFAQPWNIYRLDRKDLLMPLANTGEETAASVLHAARKEMKPYVIEPGSIMWFFRNLEKETGRFISTRSVEKRPFFNGDYLLNSDTLINDLSKLPVYIRKEILQIGESPLTEHLLFAAEPVDSILPLAAAPSGVDNVTAPLFFEKNGHIIDVKTVVVTLTFTERRNGFLSIAGHVAASSLPEEGEIRWLFRLDTASETIYPFPGMSGYKGTMFWVTFHLDEDSVSVNDSSLKIRIIIHT